MRRVIVESPYAGDIERNTLYARRAIADCLARGEAPLASHLLYTQPGILDENIPEERRKGMLAGWTWIDVAHAVVVYADYDISPGMQSAIELARSFNVRVEQRYIGK